MTSPVSYPDGTISLYGQQLALQNQMPWISYIGVDGSIFYIAGPMAPVPGAQNGIVLVKHMGLMAPFELLKLQGARQDGSTWTDTIYDAGQIMLSLEASGTTPQNINDVMRQWISAWDPEVGNNGFPTQLGKLSVFTPDLGEWWASVRLAKNISDVFTKDYTFSGRAELTWEVHNSNAFWYSVDSTSVFGVDFEDEKLDLTGDDATSISGWTQLYSQTGTGTYGIKDGSAQWLNDTSASSTDVINISPNPSGTDNQVSTIQYSPANFANFFDFIDFANGANDCWVRTDTTPAASYDAVNGVRLRVTPLNFILSYFIDGTEHIFFALPIGVPPLWGETFTLVAGTDNNPYEFALLRNGIKFYSYTDSAHVSHMGSSYRGFGFGAGVIYEAGIHRRDLPYPLQAWYGQDNASQTQSGYVPLTNMGDVEAWPRYLCYGPGTFTFGNGTDAEVTFGPIYDGQIVLVTTDPRLRSVVDVTPTQVQTPASNPADFLTEVGELIESLESFATNYNHPPLLQQFESIFGLLPPQGNLYGLMKGRFTQPVPRSYYGRPLVTTHIPVSITGAGPNSKIIAAITPRRRWPL